MAKSRKVAIMVAEQYQVTEIWYPYYRLKEAGFDCDFVAAEANKDYPSKEGLSLQVNGGRQKRQNRRLLLYDCPGRVRT